jgi:hypothetical protein
VLLAQLYDHHADECALAAERTDNPRHRAMLIKLIDEWRQAAQQLRATEDGAVSAPELGRSSRPKRMRTNNPS